MRSSRAFTVAGSLASVLVLCGCASTSHSEAECKEPKPGTITTVNAVCVIENEDPVNPAVEPVAWKGQQVGFCCKGCKPDWDAKTDAEKDALVAQAVAKSKH